MAGKTGNELRHAASTSTPVHSMIMQIIWFFLKKKFSSATFVYSTSDPPEELFFVAAYS